MACQSLDNNIMPLGHGGTKRDYPASTMVAEKIRQSWNKYNLYNLSRAKSRAVNLLTFFQLKWKAKAETRAYHGETIREKLWTRTFRKGIRSVVPMSHTYLARHDGGEQSAGRGSGLDIEPGAKSGTAPKTPYLSMVYAPAERRLDTAIFRALFASSTRQARQFVVHGDVTVNGKKMIYPGYQLNPGDMFQVEPERVLYATGAPKDRLERHAGRRIKKRMAKEQEESSEESKPSDSESSASDALRDSETKSSTPKETLKDLMAQAKTLLSNPTSSLSARRKQDLRAFQKSVKRSLSRPDRADTMSLDAQLQEITTRMSKSAEAPSVPRTKDADLPVMSSSDLQAEAAALSPDQLKTLKAALVQARENPVDPSKPYATPWRPRQYMSAFAFIPRYLEVHSKICAAVYIRHPVARPGLAEVPSPFDNDTMTLAHNWYLRRR